MATLEDIRFTIERNVRNTIDNDSVVIWCNDAQADFMLLIDIPTSTTIAVDTETLEYALPEDFKRLGRLYLESVRESGVDMPIERLYRLYNGNIIFTTHFNQEDTLNVEYFRHMTYFTDISDSIDLADRYVPLYTSYGQAQYYDLPDVKQHLGETTARREYEKHMGRHLSIKDQIGAFYTSQLQPTQIQGVW